MSPSVSSASGKKWLCPWWVSLGQQLNFHPAAFSLSPPQPAEKRENRKERWETSWAKIPCSYHHKQNWLDLGKTNLLQIKIDIKLLIWVGGNETTNIKLAPSFPLFQAPPHSITPEFFTLPPAGAGVWGVGGYTRRPWFLSVAPSPSHFSSALALSLQGSSSGVSSSPWSTFSFSSVLGIPTAVFHSYLPSTTACVVFSALLKICFQRNATSLSCGLGCVLWWVCWTLFFPQWAIFHKF